MENYVVIGTLIVAFFLILLFGGNSETPTFPDEDLYKPSDLDEEDEEMFYHPVTGYKGNRANMDAYIQNREKDLKNGNT
jgi:hypothetical protein